MDKTNDAEEKAARLAMQAINRGVPQPIITATEFGALVKLLLSKGLITGDEWAESLSKQYEEMLPRVTGLHVIRNGR